MGSRFGVGFSECYGRSAPGRSVDIAECAVRDSRASGVTDANEYFLSYLERRAVTDFDIQALVGSIPTQSSFGVCGRSRGKGEMEFVQSREVSGIAERHCRILYEFSGNAVKTGNRVVGGRSRSCYVSYSACRKVRNWNFPRSVQRRVTVCYALVRLVLLQQKVGCRRYGIQVYRGSDGDVVEFRPVYETGIRDGSCGHIGSLARYFRAFARLEGFGILFVLFLVVFAFYVPAEVPAYVLGAFREGA